MDKKKLVNNFIHQFLYYHKKHSINFIIETDNPIIDTSFKPTVPRSKQQEAVSQAFISELSYLKEIVDYENFKIYKNWVNHLNVIKRMKYNDFCICVLEPHIFFSTHGKNFLNIINTYDVFVSMVFQLPPNIHKPFSGFQPIIVVFSKTNYSEYFIGEITHKYDLLISNSINRKSSDILANGLLMERNNFKSFHTVKMQIELRNQENNYKNYHTVRLEDISSEIITNHRKMYEQENSVFVPRIGDTDVIIDINNLKLKLQNYYQIVLNKEKALAKYIQTYFNSKVGKLTLSSISTASSIRHLNITQLKMYEVAIPSLQEQKSIILANNTVSNLENVIKSLKGELSVNPRAASLILSKIEDIENNIIQISKEDEIDQLIKKGETKYIEFKQTFRKCINSKTPEKKLIFEVFKNILGMLNSEGGTILIGVNDRGKITGIENDTYTNDDKYLLFFKDKFIEYIGKDMFMYVDYNIYLVGSKKVFRIDCRSVSEPVFSKDNDFYIRINPAAQLLKGKDMFSYIKKHWNLSF